MDATTLLVAEYYEELFDPVRELLSQPANIGHLCVIRQVEQRVYTAALWRDELRGNPTGTLYGYMFFDPHIDGPVFIDPAIAGMISHHKQIEELML
jgi:hypothetical protein